MKLYIVRHAQSRRNVKQDSEQDAELSEIGKEQARRLGNYFHEVKLDRIYCSDLKRARATFEEIKPHVKGVPVSYTKKIIEHRMGIFGEGRKDDWKGYSEAAKEKNVPFISFKPKRGDSLLETYKRAGNFYRELMKKHKNDSVLLVSHGIFSMYLILNILGLDISEAQYYQLSNASVSTLNIGRDGKVGEFHINDYNHLIREGMKR